MIVPEKSGRGSVGDVVHLPDSDKLDGEIARKLLQYSNDLQCIVLAERADVDEILDVAEGLVKIAKEIVQ